MRRFLTAFILLSTIAMAQNVIVAAPSHSSGIEASVDAANTTAIGESADKATVASLSSRSVPEPSTMMLLVAGLSGLAAVATRRDAAPGSRGPARGSV